MTPQNVLLKNLFNRFLKVTAIKMFFNFDKKLYSLKSCQAYKYKKVQFYPQNKLFF